MRVDLNQLLEKTTVFVDIWSKVLYLLKHMDNITSLGLLFYDFIF